LGGIKNKYEKRNNRPQSESQNSMKHQFLKFTQKFHKLHTSISFFYTCFSILSFSPDRLAIVGGRNLDEKRDARKHVFG